MKTVIMAGGRGTRISSVARDIPKPMIRIEGKPVLEHEIACLKNQGFTDLIITVSHLGDIIMDYFGDGSKISPVTGESFGVHIEYYFEKEPLGNAGALFHLKDRLTDEAAASAPPRTPPHRRASARNGCAKRRYCPHTAAPGRRKDSFQDAARRAPPSKAPLRGIPIEH